MPRQRHRPSHSNYPVSKPTTKSIEPSQPEREITEKIHGLLDVGKTDEALRQLALAPKWIQRGPSYALLRATILMRSGDLETSGEILRDLERKNPEFIQVYLPLATWYMLHEWPAHALSAVKKVLPFSGPGAPLREMVENLEDDSREMIQSLAEIVDLPFDHAQEAEWHNEQAQLALLDDNFIEVEHQAQQALQIAPQWNAPRNNLAQVLYLMGKCSEAVAETEAVLAVDPINIHGLENMTVFQSGLGNIEKGKEYASRLFDLAKNADQKWLVNDLAIIALAVIEDDEHLWELAQRYVKWRMEDLDSSSWHCLAVAAARLGKFKDAGRFAKRAAHREDNPELVDLQDDIAAALKDASASLSWLPMYPVSKLFFPDHLVSDWLELIKKIQGDKPSPGQQRQIDAFLSRYPYVLHVFRRFLWTKKGHQAGASGLVLANKPDLDAEVLRFALSNYGDDESRMDALMMLSKTGRFTPEGPIRFWNADKREWRDVLLFSQQIGEVEYHIKPETAALIDRSRKAKDPLKAIELLRCAVENDPGCAQALHNLGALLLKIGEEEEGEQWVRKAIEVDPTYTFGFANLAFLEAQRKNEEAALDLLMHVNQAGQISPATAVIANLAYMELSIQKKDYEQARQHFELAKKIDPNHPLLDKYEEWLDRLDMFSDNFGFFADYQKQSANRFHRKMLNTPLTKDTILESCLAVMTTDALGAMCKFWGVIGYGKKQEKVARLLSRILDPVILGEVAGDLGHDEKTALHWVLDGSGSCQWKEFTLKFGDDIDESPSWQWHEPVSLPGRLKRMGFLFVGTLGGTQVAFIPVDLREKLTDSI